MYPMLALPLPAHPTQQHKGFGLIAFQNEASVEAVAAAIRANAPGWGSTATLGPARKLPADWLPHHTCK